jgi:hypothetical protein
VSTGISPPSGFNLQDGTFDDDIELGRAKVKSLEGIPFNLSILCSNKALSPDLDLFVLTNRITEYNKDTRIIGTIGHASRDCNRGAINDFISDTWI